jgi:D-alanyl-D-alanine carboxypeptidase
MQTASQQAGIGLVLLSGFRSWQTQAKLFQKQIQRRGSKTAAMELSAPPGFSEHHTGYALDIGDAQVPQSHLEVTFAKTPAFLWLQAHAHQYGFELSFSLNNPQQISYEPWHWRYINTPEAEAIFRSARGT